MIKIEEKDIVDLNISNDKIFRWVNDAFLLKSESVLPHKISLTFNQGKNFYNTMPAIIPSIDSAGVKIVSRYPNRQPSIKGDILLYSYSTGELLSIMDATWITAKRTGAVAALAVDTFAKKDFESISIIGYGAAGMAFIDMFLINPENKNKTIKLIKYKNHTERVIDYLTQKGVANIKICRDYKDLIVNSDVIVSAVTVAESNFGKDEWYKEGVLVVPIHTRGFQNCDLFFDKVFADDKAHVQNFKYFDRFRQFNEIGKVLKGDVLGRESSIERILSYNIGIAIHDIYIARKIYNILSKDKM